MKHIHHTGEYQKNPQDEIGTISLVRWLAFFFILSCLVAPITAFGATITLESSGFYFTLNENRMRFPTVTGDNEIGVFMLLIPPGVFPTQSDEANMQVTEVSITFSVYDGDTTPGDIDDDDLMLTLGITETSDLFELPLLLSGFPNNAFATATNTLDLSSDPEMGQALAAFLSRSDGFLTFFITDLDEDGNYLDFREIDPDDFHLSVTMVSIGGQSQTIDVKFHPRTLNLRSRGKWVTGSITLPEGIEESDIDFGTIYIKNISIPEGSSIAPYISPAPGIPIRVAVNGDGRRILKVKFIRYDSKTPANPMALIPWIWELLQHEGKGFYKAEITLEMKLTSGVTLAASDQIRIKRKAAPRL